MMNNPIRATILSFIFPFSSVLANGTFGDWVYVVNSDTPAALTINDSGQTLGLFCDPGGDGNCMWMIVSSTSCEKGESYPVLANSDVGAVQLELSCAGPTNDGARYILTFASFDKIQGLVDNATRIGIAIPMQGDQFRVVRFSLSGARGAIKSMLSAASEREKKQKSVGTRDISL